MIHLVKPKISVVTSKRLIRVIKHNIVVKSYSVRDIKDLRMTLTNIVAVLKRAGYDVSYNKLLI